MVTKASNLLDSLLTRNSVSSHTAARSRYGGITLCLAIGAVVVGVPTTFQTPLSGHRSLSSPVRPGARDCVVLIRASRSQSRNLVRTRRFAPAAPARYRRVCSWNLPVQAMPRPTLVCLDIALSHRSQRVSHGGGSNRKRSAAKLPAAVRRFGAPVHQSCTTTLQSSLQSDHRGVLALRACNYYSVIYDPGSQLQAEEPDDHSDQVP